MFRKSISLDAFACPQSKVTSRFASRHFAPEALAEDGLLLDWSNEVVWLNPPWALLPDVLCKLRAERPAVVLSSVSCLYTKAKQSPSSTRASGYEQSFVVLAANDDAAGAQRLYLGSAAAACRTLVMGGASRIDQGVLLRQMDAVCELLHAYSPF